MQLGCIELDLQGQYDVGKGKQYYWQDVEQVEMGQQQVMMQVYVYCIVDDLVLLVLLFFDQCVVFLWVDYVVYVLVDVVFLCDQ